MSSVPRSSRGIDSNVQFFLALDASSGPTVAELETDISEAADGVILSYQGSVLNTDGTFTINGTGSASTGNLLRDMGKTLYVQDNGKNIEIYKLVQLVNGPNGDVFYALVWAADGTGVSLVRTGY